MNMLKIIEVYVKKNVISTDIMKKLELLNALVK